jgi:hypothetical protein
VRLGGEAARADAANIRLANVILLRVRALRALNDAYDALQAEALYEARADLEASIKELSGGVNALATALTAAGAPAIPALPLVAIAERVAGESADVAQKRRLQEASRQIGAAAKALSAAVEQEAELQARIGQSVAANKEQVVDAMLQAGIADPVQAVRSLNEGLGLGTPEKLSATDPRAVVAARSLLSYGLDAPRPACLERTRRTSKR